MASFVQRALMYLGLKDIDDEDDYDGDDEEVAESRREPRAAELLSRTCAAAGERRDGAPDRPRRRARAVRRRWPAPLSCGRS